MKIFSTPLLPDSDTSTNDELSGAYSQKHTRQNEMEELNQIKDLLEEAPLYSPSETSLQIIMDYARQKQQK